MVQSPSGTSALKNHFLSSILPFPPGHGQKHFIKNKQFYKPEQFIWNNPHRTSKRLYPYYHQFQDRFLEKIKPQIQKLTEQDRQKEEEQRIRRLGNFRLQTRLKFFQRQKKREDLQAKSNSKQKFRQSLQINQQIFTYRSQSKPGKNTKRVQSYGNFLPSKITENIADSYLTSLQNYDTNLSNLQKIIGEQVFDNHNQIRLQFIKLKEKNDSNNFTSKFREKKMHSVKS